MKRSVARFFTRDRTATEPESDVERPQPAGWAPGERVLDGDFVVGSMLGSGGFGVVYLVSAEPRGRANRPYVVTGLQYAAKRVRVPSRDVKDAVMAEIQNWRELPVHPNILPYRFFREVDDEVIVFSEFAPGGSLADALSRGPVGDPLDLAIQAARGLAVLHERGLIHLDVKPQNLLFREDGSLALADFGLVGAVARREGAESGGARVRGRTPMYAAPEHYSERAGVEADVWSWGVCILELFSGAPPDVPGPEAGVALARHRAALPEPIAELLAHCLETNPSRRVNDMRQVADLLVELYESTGKPYPRPEPSSDAAPTEPAFVDRWFELRRYAIDAGHALLDAIDAAEDREDEERLDALYELLDAAPSDMTAANPDRGQGAEARAVNGLRMLRETRDVLAGMVALGHAELVDDLLDVTSAMVEEHVRHGDHFGARAIAAERVALVERLVDEGRPDLLPLLLASMRIQASLLDDMGDAERALETLDGARATIEPFLAEAQEPLRQDLVTELFIVYCEQGVTCMGIERYDEALRSLDHAFAFEQAARERWGVELDTHWRGWGSVQLANALDHVGRLSEAVAAYDVAIALLADGGGAPQELSSAHLNKGIALSRAREFTAAEVPIREAIRMREPDRESADWRERHALAFAQLSLSQVLRGRGAYAEAEAAADDAHALWEQLVQHEGHVQLGQYQYMAMMAAASAGAEIGLDDEGT